MVYIRVHLAYEIVVQELLAREDLPGDEEGIYFSADSHHTWLELAQGLAQALSTLYISKTAEVKSISVEEAAAKLGRCKYSACRAGHRV